MLMAVVVASAAEVPEAAKGDVPAAGTAKGDATKKPGAARGVCAERNGMEFWCRRVGESG